MELKSPRLITAAVGESGSNRTFMELKSVMRAEIYEGIYRSNRTFMELKLEFGKHTKRQHLF